MSTYHKPASDKQIAFMRRLADERIVHPDHDVVHDAVAGTYRPSSVDASRMIDVLLTLPKKAATVTTQERPSSPGITEPGFYLLDGTVVKVRKSRSTGNLYAESLVTYGFGETGSWQYERGLVFRLSPVMLLTYEQAAELGHRLGICVFCARELEDEDSVEAGVGPVCVKRYLGMTRKQLIARRAETASVIVGAA